MCSEHNFKAHFGGFWSNVIEKVLFFQSISSISLRVIKQKAWFGLFSRFIRNQTHRIFNSCIYSLSYIVISEIGICRQLFYNRFGSYKIHMLNPFSIFWFIVSMEISIIQKHIQPTGLNLFPKSGVISTSIRIREGS